MGFGDFAMGYLLGQSFAGPVDTNIPIDYKYWSKEAKAQHQKNCDEAYWSAWDFAYKQKTIEDLRLHPENGIPRFKDKPIFGGMSTDRIAELIECGEIQLIHFHTSKLVAFLWVDESRDEAQWATYQSYLQRVKEQKSKESFRVVS
ncbi:hypothetical protein [uncultured Helicobacter sp.]|uniref:hypothetical protein n=1 Tax=uncultured Helicobacter sp. TaxID=175537 RepID=UPI00374F9955